MTVLGIDTATAVCSVGIADENGSIAEKSVVESHIHSEKILTLIQDVCNEGKTELSRFSGIAVSIGPGSFTGLRIGLSTAKGLCYALGKPLIAVSTFDSVAKAVFDSLPGIFRQIILVDAKQGDYYIGGYERKNGENCEFLPVQIINLTSAVSSFTKETSIITDKPDEIRKFADKCGVIDNILSYCRGDILARIGVERLKAGIQNAPEDLEPMYLKDFIVRKQERTR